MRGDHDRRNTVWLAFGVLVLLMAGAARAASPVFARFCVLGPGTGRFRLTVAGYSRESPWQLPSGTVEMAGGAWSQWFDASMWPLHARFNRSGGIAEWPAMRVTVAKMGDPASLHGCSLRVQLADKPAVKSVVHSFSEESES